MRRAVARLLVGGILLAACLTGCGSHGSLTVSPKAGLSDTTLHVRVSGAAGDRVRLTTKDADGHVWTSTVAAPKHGTGDLGPRLADGLARADKTPSYFIPPGHWTVRVALRDGDNTVASRTVVRRQPLEAGLVTETKIRPSTPAGLYGDLFSPTKRTTGATAVLLIGGSEGGTAMDDAAALMAAHGHPALVAGYFDLPGKPRTLADIPLEQLHQGLRRLAATPGVDASQIDVLGVSRGSEAALLTATLWPGEVHNVIDSVPSSVVNPSPGTFDRAAWTLSGKPLPYTKVVNDVSASGNPAARIDASKTRGELLLICGEDDQLWSSCPYARAIQKAAPGRSTLLAYAGAGHLAGEMVPNVPYTLFSYRNTSATFGGTPPADEAARRAMWPKILAFLDRG